MKTLKTLLILAVALTALNSVANPLQAGKFGISISVGGHNFHGGKFHGSKPRCSDPHRCPPRRYPLPQPQPVHHDYHLGVWTSLVELVSPEGQPAAALGQPTTATAHAQPNFGLQIDSIVRHSAAERAGLKPGDVLLAANDISLQCKKDLFRAVRNSHGRLILQVLDVHTGQVAIVKAYPTRK